jgi:hypothetical protein
MPISGKLCDRCVTVLLALFLGFIALSAELIAELHIVEVSQKDMASLTARCHKVKGRICAAYSGC